MLIERILKDGPNGTFITMADGTRYAFAPLEVEGAPHVAEVTNTKHIERFLAIPEGFRIWREGAPAEPDDPASTPDDQTSAVAALETTIPAADAQDDPIALEEMTLTDLQGVFEREVGRKPHHRAGIEKLIEDITAHRSAQET